jgi:biopolymer transport protein ExbD
MAFSIPAGGSGGRRRRGSMGTLAEINIIPLVDVVLVLLIIFMLTAHVMEFGLEVDVPKVNTVKNSADELPVVTLAKDGALQLNEKPVANINVLADEIKKRFPGQKGVYVRADKAVLWDLMANVFSVLGEAQLDVRAVTQPVEDTPNPRR